MIPKLPAMSLHLEVRSISFQIREKHRFWQFPIRRCHPFGELQAQMEPMKVAARWPTV